MMANLDTARESRAAAAIACVLAGALTCCGARTAVEISPRDASTEVRLDAGPSDAGPRPSACDPPTATCTWRAGETVPLGDGPAQRIVGAASCDRGEFAFAYAESSLEPRTRARVVGGSPLRVIADVALPRDSLSMFDTREGWVNVGVARPRGVCTIDWRRADFSIERVDTIAGTYFRCDADMTGEDEFTIFALAASPEDRSSVHVVSISSRRIVRSVELPDVARFVVTARTVPDGNILALFLTRNDFPLFSHVGAVLVGGDGRALIETGVREFSSINPQPDREGPGFIAMLNDASFLEIRLVRVASDSDSIRTEDLGVLTGPGSTLSSNAGELTTLPHHYLARGADGRMWTVGTDDMSIRVIPPPDVAFFELSGGGIASSYGTAYVAHIWSDRSRVFLRRLSCEP